VKKWRIEPTDYPSISYLVEDETQELIAKVDSATDKELELMRSAPELRNACLEALEELELYEKMARQTGDDDLFLYGLAVWRISSLLVHEDGPYAIFRRIREASKGFEVFWQLFQCVWCTSVWIGGGVLILWFIEPTCGCQLQLSQLHGRS
jgi:hypothetical protein